MDKRDDGSGILNMGQEVAAGVWRAKAGLARKGGMAMHTISDIVADVERHCAIYNMMEDRFSYRIVYYVNEGGVGIKHYIYSTYDGLRRTLETIVKNNLSLENTLVFAQTTVRKDGACVCLQSRSYKFSLEGYFQVIYGRQKRRDDICNGRSARAAYGN